MSQRTPSLAERLRGAWQQRTSDSVLTSTGRAPEQRDASKGSAFADRLRAAVSTRA